MNNTLPVTAPTAHAPTPSPAPAPKLGAGNMASRWRELHGSDSWKGLLDPLDVDLRRSIIAYGELASAAHDGFNLEKRSPHAGLCLYSRDRLLSASTVTHPEYYKVTKFLYATCGGSTVSRLATSVPTVTSALFVQPLGKAEETPTSNWMGYVAVATEEGVAALGRRDIVVVWRGTENDLEWEQDKHCRQVSAAPVLGRYAHDEYRNAEVHRGFLSVYTSSDNNSMYNKTSAREQVSLAYFIGLITCQQPELFKLKFAFTKAKLGSKGVRTHACMQVLEEVGRLMKEYKEEVTSITVTGHSLGASLATLTAIDMVANDVNVPPASNQPPCPVTAILLASPRVGNDAFKSAFGSFDHLRALHVANAKDIVPMNPPSVLLLMQYVDSATVTIVIDTDRSPYVVHKMLTHHVLELYLHGVAGDHGDKADFQLVVPRDLALVNKTTDLLNDEHQDFQPNDVVDERYLTNGLPFSTKNAYNLLIGSPDNDTSVALIWASRVPIKVQVFGSLLFQGQPLPQDRHLRHHLCALLRALQDAAHIVLLCPDSVAVWLALQLNAPSSIAEIWGIDTPLGQDDETWPSVALAILWKIWDSKNSMSFRGTRHLVHVTVQNIVNDFTLWTAIFRRPPFRTTPGLFTMLDPAFDKGHRARFIEIGVMLLPLRMRLT
ncbi:Phospholipase A1-II 7 [Hordeum vulgare]|nr:Phospholipase A1-II 7 [Hordeum vulgare]